MSPSLMRFSVLLKLALLAFSWSLTECVCIVPGDPSHAQVNLTSKHAYGLGRGFLSRLGFELQIKKLMEFSLEDYDDMEASPALAEANHGPIVFFRPKRRRRSPGLHP